VLCRKLAVWLIIFLTFTVTSFPQSAFAAVPIGTDLSQLPETTIQALITAGIITGSLEARDKIKTHRNDKEHNDGKETQNQAIKALWALLPFIEEFTLSEKLTYEELKDLWQRLQQYYYKEENGLILDNEANKDSAIKDINSIYITFYQEIKGYLKKGSKITEESHTIIKRVNEFHDIMNEKIRQHMSKERQSMLTLMFNR
jgi:hypothetical protein